MLKSLFKLFHDPSRDQTMTAIPSKVTEAYLLPAEAVEEYWILTDAFMAAPSQKDGHANWKRWAHIARNVPAVAADPIGEWKIDDSEILVVMVRRKVQVSTNAPLPFSVVETQD